ncbi:hypothetical protein D9Q98_007920 [Chlorella vulgaris]|uniref:Uncharacterized protein n=1 Tax=Chlorella vulgaris TaxID=3077 RepID=A0A9D4THY4_CHLVU|nr:hypothetical protein D9Q98_007920 [Chlorella vulgaris]
MTHKTVACVLVAVLAIWGCRVEALPSWKSVGVPTFQAAIYTHLAIHPVTRTPLIVYRGIPNLTCIRCVPRYKAQCLYYTTPQTGWLDLSYGLDSPAPNSPEETRIALSPAGQPYVAFRDNDADGKLSLTRWSETTAVWSPVFTGVTSSTVSSVNLEIHPTLGPVMCFQDSSNGGKASCLRYVGGNSTAYVGAPGFTPLAADFVSMAVRSSSGEIVVAFQVVTTGLGSAMLWTPATKQFKALGGAFSKGEASRISTAFNPTTGRPWVAFLGDAVGHGTGTGKQVTVVRWTGSAWVLVGPNGFAGPDSQFHSLAFNPVDASAWLAYQCTSAARKLCVRRFDSANNAWALKGPAGGISVGAATYITLKFTSNGVPYVAYSDAGQGGVAVVKKWL